MRHGFPLALFGLTVAFALPARAGPAPRCEALGQDRRQAAPAAEREAAGLASLSDGLAPLKKDFNAAKGRRRFLAILSPTCPACIHGAQAIREAILPEGNAIEVFVVWTPMLAADGVEAASAGAPQFPERVHQYWDPERRVGAALRRDVFPDSVARMKRSLPPGHFFAPYLDDRDESRPEWDIYLLFESAAQWDDRAPTPSRWVRQVARFGRGQGEGPTSLMWRNDYARPPVEGSLVEQLAELVAQPAPAAGGAR